jgi:CheY-like chemotaxis protein
MSIKMNCVSVDDEIHNLDVLQHFLNNSFDINIEKFTTTSSILERINDPDNSIDFITTDIIRPDINGFDFINILRNTPLERVNSDGLRIRNIPIIVISAVADSYYSRLQKFNKDGNINFIIKPINSLELSKVVVSSISNYQYLITQDLLKMGLSITFIEGRFRIGNSFLNTDPYNNKYFTFTPKSENLYNRIIVLRNNIKFQSIALTYFEELINDTATKERDLQFFFQKHPEFLADAYYELNYPEMKFEQGRNNIRPDFIQQPFGITKSTSRWNIVEIKKHTAKLISNESFHSKFSSSVYRGISQLRDYRNYFNDKSNEAYIKNKLPDINATPKLTLLIGRTPKNIKRFIELKDQVFDVSILTYDDILTLKKIELDFTKLKSNK